MRRYRPSPIRIVEIEHLRLREDVGGAEACWMPRVSLYLDRPAHLVLDHDAGCVSVSHIGGGVEVRQAGNNVWPRPHRWN